MTVLLPPSDPLLSQVDPRIPSVEPVSVYEPTRSGMPPLRPYFREVWQRRTFIWHLARTQLKAENYESVAGQVWILLNPLIMAFIYLTVRSIFRGTADDRGQVISHLVTGIFFFRFASAGINAGARSVMANRQMVLNTAFPRLIFPLAAAVQAVMELLPTIVVIFAIHWYLDQPMTYNVLYLPLLVVLLLIFNLGISFLFAPLNVIYQDVKSTMPHISKVWLFATPIMYSVADVEANNPDILPILQLNPLFGAFSTLERIFDGVPPHQSELIMAIGWAVGTFVIGLFLFLRMERLFARRL